MYVIYPADELISLLISREYSPVEEQQRVRHQQRQQIIVPAFIPEHSPIRSSSTAQLFLADQPGVSQSQPTSQAGGSSSASSNNPPQPSSSSLNPSSNTKLAEIERKEPARPPRAVRENKKQSSSSKSSSNQQAVVNSTESSSGEPPKTERQKPKRSISFTAPFRSRSKSRDKETSSSGSNKVAPGPEPVVPKQGFRFGLGSSRDKLNSGAQRQISVPRITFAFEQEDSSFADFRGQNFHGGVSQPASSKQQQHSSSVPPVATSSGSSSRNKAQLKLNLPASASATSSRNNNGNGGNNSGHSNGGSGGGNNGSAGESVIAGRVRGGSPSPSPVGVRLTPPIGGTGGSSSSQINPFGRNSISRELSSGSGGGGGGSSKGSTMAGLGLNGGSISGSLLTLGVGHHGLHGHGHVGAGGAQNQGLVVDANSFKDCAHPSLNETLKSHNALSFKVIRIVSDFTQQLSQLHEQHSVQLQMLVENFRKRNSEIRKERPPCGSTLFQIWETLLQEVEIDSQAHSDISGSLGRQIARPLLEKTFCLKIQSRKVFAHRESFETVLSKAEALLANAYRDYNDACLTHMQQGNNATLVKYYDAHNAYVQQLRGTNAMLREYHNETLPALLQELEEVYVDLVNTLSESILLGSEIVSTRAQETNRRYETLTAVCRGVNGNQDLKEFVKSMTVPAAPPPAKHTFQTPLPLLSSEAGEQDLSHVPILKDEVIMERQAAASARTRVEALKKEITSLEAEMKTLQDAMDTLIRMQERSLDSNLFNKANELQEEISMKRFDLRVAQMHYAALKSQKELYLPGSTGKGEGGGGTLPGSGLKGASASSKISNALNAAAAAGEDDPSGGNAAGKGGDRKMSVVPGGMKSKWLKAFKSLKSTNEKEPEKKNGKDKELKEPFQIFENHIFQEYTYKKITPCDICSQILRGHTRQGLRCRMCKMNVHLDCQEKVGKCQPKTRLLRRQRSTSELETRLTQLTEQQQPDDEQDSKISPGSGGGGGGGSRGQDELDMTYQVLKEANAIKKPGGGGSGSTGSGSGNGLHGSNQTLHSQHEMTPSRVGRSNPSVNIISGNSSGHSGPSTPVHPSVAAASSSGKGGVNLRRDSYFSRKSVSADVEGSSNLASINLPPRSTSLAASPMPHSPRRRKLDLRMKSFSLDSPESTEHAQRRRYAHGSHSTSHSQSWGKPSCGPSYTNGGASNRNLLIGNGMVHSNSASNNHASSSSSSEFFSQPPFASLNHFAPSSPVHNRRALLSARNVRMSSVELPDENDKSLSSASTSPCPSPQKPHRLLPTNLYVCLYIFTARHPDELDLKAGNRVTVTDTSDPDWWQGKCMGRIGYFPSKYVTKLHPGEKPLQVTHNLQVTDGADNGLKLLRDQIVIQIGEELDGMVTIRNGDNKQGICPVKYLQEV